MSASGAEMSSVKGSKGSKRGQPLPSIAASSDEHLPASTASILASSSFAGSAAAPASHQAASAYPSLAPIERYDAFTQLVRSTAEPIAVLRDLGKSVQSASSRSAIEAASRALTAKSDEVQTTLRKARAQLKQIEAEDAVFSSRVGPSTAASQIRDNLRSQASRALASSMSDLRSALERAQAELARRSERELRIVAPELPPEDVARLIECDKVGEFVQAHLLSDASHPPSTELLARVAGIQERQIGILSLQRQVVQLADLFKDLSFLVESQQISIDSIDRSIRSARNSTEAAEETIQEAKEYQTKATWRKCCLLLLVTCLLAAVLAPTLLAKFGKIKL